MSLCNTYLGFGLNLKINDRTCPQTSKNSWSEKWWLLVPQLCLVLYPLSNSKFVEGQLGVHRPANSFGKKSRENKACTAALHNCTPCSHASDVSQLFAHAKSLSDSWWFNKDRLCTSATKKIYKCKQLYWIGASGKILCAPWQQRDWERRERVSLRVGGESKGLSQS